MPQRGAAQHPAVRVVVQRVGEVGPAASHQLGAQRAGAQTRPLDVQPGAQRGDVEPRSFGDDGRLAQGEHGEL